MTPNVLISIILLGVSVASLVALVVIKTKHRMAEHNYSGEHLPYYENWFTVNMLQIERIVSKTISHFFAELLRRTLVAISRFLHFVLHGLITFLHFLTGKTENYIKKVKERRH